MGPENLTLERAGGTIAFHARDARIVLSRGTEDPIPFPVTLDGEAPDMSHGVDGDGNGVLQEPRMYQLIRQHAAVRITFRAPGAEVSSFTFGDAPR